MATTLEASEGMLVLSAGSEGSLLGEAGSDWEDDWDRASGAEEETG